jgi:hypothetical protein
VGAESSVVIDEGYTEFTGFAVVDQKPLGYSVEPQNRGRRLDEQVRPPRLVQPPRRGGHTAWAGLIAQGGGLTAQAAAAEKLRSGGHASGRQCLR